MPLVQPDPCIDCPAVRLDVLREIVPPRAPCALRCVTLAARAVVPARWFGDFEFALVRRGALVRQRVDVSGRATAIDVAGPGGLAPLSESVSSGSMTDGAAYAASETKLCLAPRGTTAAAAERTPRLALDLLALHAAAMDRVERIADARSRPTARARVAALLCALEGAVPLGALQQRDVAAVLALRHESVCRAMRALERAGAIARDASGPRIVERAGLEAE